MAITTGLNTNTLIPEKYSNNNKWTKEEIIGFIERGGKMVLCDLVAGTGEDGNPFIVAVMKPPVGTGVDYVTCSIPSTDAETFIGYLENEIDIAEIRDEKYIIIFKEVERKNPSKYGKTYFRAYLENNE